MVNANIDESASVFQICFILDTCKCLDRSSTIIAVEFISFERNGLIKQ